MVGGRRLAVLMRDPLPSCSPREQPDEVSQTVLAASVGRRSGTKGAMRVAGHAWHLGRPALPCPEGKTRRALFASFEGASFFNQIGDGFRRLRGRVTGKQVEDELNV